MRESKIEAYLVKRVKEFGGEVRKLKWVGRRGAPDRLVMLFETHLFVELKSTTGKTSPHQQRDLNLMQEYGIWVEVVSSLEGVDDLIRYVALRQAVYLPPNS